MSLVIFSHGKETGPIGTKILLLSKVAEELGFSVLSVDYTQCKDASERVSLLKETIGKVQEEVDVLVGSSMGGYVSTVMASEFMVKGLFLMCPALYMENGDYEVQEYSPKAKHIEIVHGWNDDIVPFENSIRFGEQVKAKLHLVDDNHRLVKSHDFLKQIFSSLLHKVKG